MHVHLRDPGQTEKEDFYTGTSAALAGGFTTVFDMPNNKTPITTKERLDEKIKIAKEKIVCNVGFYFGSLGDNLEEFEKVKDAVFGLKLYLNITTGHFLIDEKKLEDIYDHWAKNKLILVHAENSMVRAVINLVRKTRMKTHFCHVSSREELEPIIGAKNEGLPVTCGVTLHHLMLTESNVSTLHSFGMMKPSLKTLKDKQFLWKNFKTIDVIESDHAPHTITEKQSVNPPFGVPGLETTLPLLLYACKKGMITHKDIVEKCFTNPARILSLQPDNDTFIEVDEDVKFEITAKNFQSKCKWTPFEGWKVRGKVRRVYLRGKKVFEDDRVLVKPGFGRIVGSPDPMINV